MTAWVPFEPFSPDRLPDPSISDTEPDPLFTTIYRASVGGGDAYRATRLAVRRDGPILRVGNRFVRVDRYREIAFAAIGAAAPSQALAVTAALGPAVTQGFMAGPDPLPREVPFRGTVAPMGWPGSTETVAEELLELAAGLSERDLFLLLLSPGSLGYLATAPPGVQRADWTSLLQRVSRTGASSREVALVARCLGSGAAGGRLVRSTRADLVPLVVDRGDGADLVGGGPTLAVTEAERTEVQAILGRAGVEPTDGRFVRPGNQSAGVGTLVGSRSSVRPVAIVTPADALRDAADAVSDKRWRPTLAALAIEGGVELAADRFVERAETAAQTAINEGLPSSGGRASHGVVAFAGTTLGLPEGVDDDDSVLRFLRQAGSRIHRRDATVALLRTAGASDGHSAPGGVIGAAARPGTGPPGAVRPLRMRPGITDVGYIAVMAVPAR
ncbi:MAG TPA: DUF4147 domain-containing protein [Thermoplasmata archaeon]|nr:DUF4147 domain-containing protein [Thermoplasmata archaeon]